jgi:hypothetical protein
MRPKQKGFVKIDKVITKTAKERKLDLALNSYEIKKHWEEVVCSFFDQAEGLTKALGLKNGCLTVACLSKDLAYQLKVLASRIIYTLNQVLGRQVVFALNVEY